MYSLVVYAPATIGAAKWNRCNATFSFLRLVVEVDFLLLLVTFGNETVHNLGEK